MSLSDRVISGVTKLDGTNYHDWKFAVSIVLRSRGCWEVVSGMTKKPSDVKELEDWMKKAEDGLMIIGLTVQPSQYIYIRDAADGAAAWESLRSVHEKNSRATRISLKRQFYGFEHDPTMPMQSYVNGITDLAGKLKAIGITLTDEEVTDVLIFNLNADYASIASTLTASKADLSISDVTGALLEEERRRGGPLETESANTGLYSDGRGPPGRNGPYRDRRDGLANNQICYRCRRTGHIAKFCHATTYADGSKIPAEPEKAEDRSSFAQTVNETLNDIIAY